MIYVVKIQSNQHSFSFYRARYKKISTVLFESCMQIMFPLFTEERSEQRIVFL